jgi:hypothetical protein
VELQDRSRKAIITGLVVYGAALLVSVASFAVYQLVRSSNSQGFGSADMRAYSGSPGAEAVVLSRGQRCIRIAADKETGALHEEAIPGCGDAAPEMGSTKSAFEGVRDAFRNR